MPGEGAADEADLSQRDRFKIQTYLVMIDSLLTELEKRMKAYDDISKIFWFLSSYPLTSLSNENIEKKAKNIISSYVDDLEDTLAAELIQFAAPRNLWLWTNLQSWPYRPTSFCHRWICLRCFQTSKLRCASICAWWCPMRPVRRAELLKVGESQRGSAIFSGAGKAHHACWRLWA